MGDLNAAIEKQAGEVETEKVTVQDTLDPAAVVVVPAVEQEPVALVPEGAPAILPHPTQGGVELETEIKAKALALETYITAGVAKATASLGSAEIVTVSAFKAAVEALLRHLHADHPENYF